MNPYLLPRPALISFSGGRTSGFMLHEIIDAFHGELPSDVIPVFANTGMEHERTYEFVAEVSRNWCPVVTVERQKGGGFVWGRVEDCRRAGEPFSELIDDKSYLPNPVTRICTANLKIAPMAAFARSLGWERWTVAVGLRADEPRRVAKLSNGQWNESWDRVAPLASAGATIEDVTAFWLTQSFDLRFPSGSNLLGNCVGCFLKSKHRLDEIVRQEPHALDWWAAQERRRGATFRADRPSYAALIQRAREQPRLWEPQEESLPCDCHE